MANSRIQRKKEQDIWVRTFEESFLIDPDPRGHLACEIAWQRSWNWKRSSLDVVFVSSY
jgi:hypothetical protein